MRIRHPNSRLLGANKAKIDTLRRGKKMDYTLDIIIPKEEAETVKLYEKQINWGNNFYSCEPPQYITDSNIVFEQINSLPYFKDIIGDELPNDSIVLYLKSDILFDLEYAVNNNVALEENRLLIFLNRLFELSYFYIFMVQEDEKVKEQYRIVKKEEIYMRLSESLRWSNPKDILLFKKNES